MGMAETPRQRRWDKPHTMPLHEALGHKGPYTRSDGVLILDFRVCRHCKRDRHGCECEWREGGDDGD